MTPFAQETIKIILSIPAGKIASYGQIAAMAGNPRAARQVSRILHSCSRKYNLPWHRIINSQGKISLKNEGYQRQYQLLKKEGIVFGLNHRIDFKLFGFCN